MLKEKEIFCEDFEFDKGEKVVIPYSYWSEEKEEDMEPDFLLNAENA